MRHNLKEKYCARHLYCTASNSTEFNPPVQISDSLLELLSCLEHGPHQRGAGGGAYPRLAAQLCLFFSQRRAFFVRSAEAFGAHPDQNYPALRAFVAANTGTQGCQYVGVQAQFDWFFGEGGFGAPTCLHLVTLV